MKKYLFLLIPIALWGSTPAVGKLLVGSMIGMNIFFLASLIAVLTSFLLIIFLRRTRELTTTINKKNLPHYLLNGILLFFYYFFLYQALSSLNAQEAFIVNYLWPIMAVLATAALLKERFSRFDLIGLFISFIGVYIIATKGHLASFNINNLKGIGFAMSDATMYGLFTALAKKNTADSLIKNFYYYLFGCLFSLTLLFIFNLELFNYNALQLRYLLWLGVFPYCLASFSWFLALENFKTAKAASVLYLTPFVSLIYIRLLVGEKIAVASIVGLVVIVTGILIQSFKHKNDN